MPPPALQSSGPAACLKKDEAKAVMAAWVSWADHLATKAPTTLGKCPGARQGPDGAFELSPLCYFHCWLELA